MVLCFLWCSDHMNMLAYSRLQFDLKPEGVNTNGNDSEKQPFNVIAEELTAVSVKSQLMTVNGGVFYVSGLF